MRARRSALGTWIAALAASLAAAIGLAATLAPVPASAQSHDASADRAGGGGGGDGAGQRRRGPSGPAGRPSDGAIEVGAEREPGYGTANPLAIENAICSRHLREAERRNCRATGTPEGRYPTSNYGFDVHIDTGITKIAGNFRALLAQIANAIWIALLFVLNLIITLLGWAFELNPFGPGSAMRELSGALERFYRTFTRPWLVAAMVIVGAAGAWRGLGRRDVAGALGGTILAVVLMVAALWVIHAPRQSVGKVAEISNQAAQSAIAAPRGSLRNPASSYAEATAEVWHAMTIPGFAALNFSDVDWALRAPDSDVLAKADETVCLDYAYLRSLPPERVRRLFTSSLGRIDCAEIAEVAPVPRTNAEVWLRSSPGSRARDALWDEFGDRHPHGSYLAIQGDAGAFTRLPLVAVIGLGLIGGIALLAWLAVRLLVQTAVAFVLVLMTPLALFLPAFGEAGRRAFGFWAQTLAGALVAKLIYAAVLSVVLLATTVISGLVGGDGGVGTLMSFLVMAGLWWAVFLKREQLVAAISLADGQEGGSGRLGSLAGLYGGMRIGQALARPLTGAAGIGASAAAGGFRAARAGAGDRGEATRRIAGAQIDRRAERRLDARYEAERRSVARQGERRSQLAELAAGRSDAMRAARRSTSAARQAGEPSARERAERERQGALERAREIAERQRVVRAELEADAPAAERSRRFVDRASERERNQGRRWSESELAGAREAIRHEVDRPVAAGVHAWRVGMSPERYEALRGSERERAHGQVASELRADRLAFGAIPDRPAGIVDPGASRRYRRELRRTGAEGGRALRRERAVARRERVHGPAGRRPAVPRPHRPSRRGVSR